MVVSVGDANFDEVTGGAGLVLLDFYADWCAPCRMQAPFVAEIAAEYPALRVGKVNVDEEPALAARFGVASIPTLVVLRGSALLARTVGLTPTEELRAMLADCEKKERKG